MPQALLALVDGELDVGPVGEVERPVARASRPTKVTGTWSEASRQRLWVTFCLSSARRARATARNRRRSSRRSRQRGTASAKRRLSGFPDQARRRVPITAHRLS